jgi:hypothetical protein
MKTTSLIFTLILALPGFVAFGADTPKSYQAESSSSSETFRTRILKVHHFVEGDFQYTAYTVDWRGHEVVVPVLSTAEILKEGDEIRCQMRSSAVKAGDAEKGALSFSIVSTKTISGEQARLEAVAAEVMSRRAKRAAEAARDEAKTKN